MAKDNKKSSNDTDREEVMRKQKKCFSFVLNLVGVIALSLLFGVKQVAAEEFTANYYDLYFGDLNADGYDDVYLKAKKQLLIIAGDISTPIFIPPSVPSYSILSNGNVDYADPVVDETVDVSQLTLHEERFLIGDFNGDGYRDAFVHVTGLGVDSFTLAGGEVGQAPVILQQNLSDVSNYELAYADI
ncbi:MAG: hypothetical protein R3E62_10045 [Pseudomonadales bacterium]